MKQVVLLIVLCFASTSTSSSSFSFLSGKILYNRLLSNYWTNCFDIWDMIDMYMKFRVHRIPWCGVFCDDIDIQFIRISFIKPQFGEIIIW